MPKLNKEMIQYLSKLSRIHCTEEEETTLLNDLKKILTYIDQLNAINTNEVLPCHHVLATMDNVMREDDVSKTLPRDTFLENAPSQVSGLIRVPPVIKSNSKP